MLVAFENAQRVGIALYYKDAAVPPFNNRESVNSNLWCGPAENPG